MFTGIIQGNGKVISVEQAPGFLHYCVAFPPHLLEGLQIGASVSLDGACQTVVSIDSNKVWFDAIEETLLRTTLSDLAVGRIVNLERAARFGDEIGGHILSGHVFGKAQIVDVEESEYNAIMTVQCPPNWMKYFFEKGYVALDGASLTLVEVDPKGLFTVHLIPETRRLTTLGFKKEGDLVNLELDAQTQSIVETVERLLKEKYAKI